MERHKPMGLIAGCGELPLAFARQARNRGYQLITAAIQGSASRRLNALSSKVAWISPGQLGTLLSFFKKNLVEKTVMLGKVQHSGAFRGIPMDWKALSLWWGLKNRSGEGILTALASEMEKNGTEVLDSRTWMEENLAPKGWLSRGKGPAPSPDAIRQGLKWARALSKAGVGQTILLKRNAVVAVEAMEGTDETVRRAGKWAGPGTILVKVANPRQDWRFDVPTVGLGTIRSLAKARAGGLVVEAGKVFLMERDRTLAEARKNGLFIFSV